MMEAKDEIKQRLSVEEVVSDYMELRRSGRNFKALSPFTSEKTPSFMVSPEKQIWHDFSSNKGGDIFSFIMEVEGVDFREALEILAKKAGVDLGVYKKGDRRVGEIKKRMSEALELAAQFYHLSLSKNQPALDYVKNQRKFNVDTIRTWRLGYSPDSGRALYDFLKKRGFKDDELKSAGLITQRRSGLSDMFRGRIMIPLCDRQGGVVGFTARLLRDEKNAPKYFNTPQTLLYDKGRQVFGYHHAKESIRKTGEAVLVEGNLDVIASHQAGVHNVVAAAGTALTADHLRSVGRIADRVKLAFDGDDAGLKASERAIFLAQEAGVELEMVLLPSDAKDPDELIGRDVSLWQRAIKGSIDAVSWNLQRYEKLFDKTTPQGKRSISSKALAVLAKLKDPVEREHHIQKIAESLGISSGALTAKLDQTKQPPARHKPIKAKVVDPDRLAYEDDFLALNAFYPDVRDSLGMISKESLHSDRRRRLFEALLSLPAKKRLDEVDLSDLHEIKDYVKILLLIVEERYRSFQPAEQMSEAMALARRMAQTKKIETKEELTAKIREAEQRGDHDTAAKLLADYQSLLS